jgi:hypothetical protein
MRCYLHADTDASATCVSCGRGLCHSCEQITRDERILCGLPQCAEFVKRQSAVQFAMRESSVGYAATRNLLAEACRSLALILMIPSAAALVVSAIVTAFSPFWFTGDVLLTVMAAVMGLLVSTVILRIRKGLLALAQNWKDISQDFGSAPAAESPAEQVLQAAASGTSAHQ